ncbi:YycH family regulatory protein [Litchfieldia alkalitelluris]|uniref:YycH family regulatory protein n=1 Tax=Litchfieldia alkalitelluris TaxID=304268 RepID=UPI0009985692|nr:two-component system activity regulator YycH [Litchfieldia alkalitelluris]
MSYESIKSFVLTVLVLLSILLTWGLWTYHPELDTIENNTIIKDVSISNKKDIPSLIKPTKVMFHTSSQHFGTVEETEINALMKDVRKWEIYELTNISASFSTYDFLPFLQRDGHVQILFSDDLPINIHRSIFKFSDDELPSASFDRVIINVNSTSEGGNIYFVSVENQLIYEAKVSYESIRDFENNHYTVGLSLPEYFSYGINETESIFLPFSETTMNSVQYYTDYLDAEMFKEALFIEPNIVKKHILTYGEEYTDGSRLLSVFSGKKSFQFVNPVNTTESAPMNSYELIKSSVDFINEHGGWTDKYRFFSYDKYNQETVFRLYVRNFPVFNKNGLTEIQQSWNKNEIMRYNRPLLVLEIPIPAAEVILPSGEVVINAIKSQVDFDPTLLEDISIGYELVEFPEKNNVATLVPIWSYKYNGWWRKIELSDEKEVGGNEGGLE